MMNYKNNFMSYIPYLMFMFMLMIPIYKSTHILQISCIVFLYLNLIIHPIFLCISYIMYVIMTLNSMYLMKNSTLYFYMIFIIAISGMMVMFLYISSIYPNVKIKSSLWKILIAIIISSLGIYKIKETNIMNFQPMKNHMYMIYLNNFLPLTLLLTLFMILTFFSIYFIMNNKVDHLNCSIKKSK
uniref:NADH dehydrogenase subunit 6 n=1 Tax=Ammophila clavus TaxID=2594619 RepID=UPI003001F133